MIADCPAVPLRRGSSVGKNLVENGGRVLWASAGRSPESRFRAEEAGLEDAGSLEELLKLVCAPLCTCPATHPLPTGGVDCGSQRCTGPPVDCGSVDLPPGRCRGGGTGGGGIRIHRDLRRLQRDCSRDRGADFRCDHGQALR